MSAQLPNTVNPIPASGRIKPHELPTYVYVDASNIRNACRLSCSFQLDFHRLYDYLESRYPSLGHVKYFEGIEKGDTVKKSEMEALSVKWFEVLSLERIGYSKRAIHKDFECQHCNLKTRHEIAKARSTFKSNIDVFLATEFLFDVSKTEGNAHFILVSCDGDYAEMIKKVLDNYGNVTVSVLATPYKRDTTNYLSVRFKELDRLDRYYLMNVMNFKDYVKRL